MLMMRCLVQLKNKISNELVGKVSGSKTLLWCSIPGRVNMSSPYTRLLVARQGDVSRKLNHVCLLVDSFNFNFVDEEHTNICNTLSAFGSVDSS